VNVKWLFGRRKPADAPAPTKDIPRDDDRCGPVPPPPRTAHAPGVSVCRFDEISSQSLLRFGEGCGGFFLKGEDGSAHAAALLVLTGGGASGARATSPGDVLIWAAGASQPHHHTKRDGVGGAAFPGITGLRVLARLPEAGLAVLRLGPPPGARWAFRGVRAFAVFSGRLAVFDGDDAKEVRAGSLARVADPTATLYLEAGNDAALAVALAAADFVAALS
jgi:hypothetical protein